MRRAGGLLLLVALAAGCSTGTVDDLPAAAGATVGAVAVPAPVVPVVPVRGNYAEVAPGPPPVPAPIRLPSDPLEYFRGLESACSRAASLATRGRGGLPLIEPERFRDAVLVRELTPYRALIQDGRGTRLVLDNWPTTGRVLPGSGRATDPLPEPYRSGCPDSAFVGG